MKSEILIIDDDEISIMLTEMLVEEAKFFEKPHTFTDGVYALEYLESTYSKGTQYVVLLDINMPLMDGWEFLKRVEEFEMQENFFVFMLSSSTDEADIDTSKKISCVKGYFCKPLKKEDVEKVQQSLQV